VITSLIGNGVFELRVNHCPGYRVYFGQVSSEVILLLWGGDKDSQENDIVKAKGYWASYQRREDA
jgi:putative addiction module killer protein